VSTALAKLGVDLNAYRFMYDDGNAPGVINPGRTSAATEYDLIGLVETF